MKQFILAALFSLAPAFASADTPLVEQGRAALLRHDAATAANLLEKAIAEHPNDADAHYLLGNAYGTLIDTASFFSKPGLASKAHTELESAVRLDPNHMLARFGLIQFYLQAPAIVGGGVDKAIEQANEIRKRDAIDGHRAFAMIAYQQKKPDVARKEWTDAVKEQPNSARAHYWLGTTYFPDRNLKAASAEFETSIKLDPSYMPGWFQVGHIAALTGENLQRGEEALHKYMTYRPKEDEPPVYRAQYWLGAIYEKEGRKADAKANYAASLNGNPSQRDVQEAIKRVQ